ncbi:MAG TPA: GNAT family N-acetyltransferase [Desulfobacteria bacterium]|nr:GNAT family N-acetyltransferase [Desulfobacteria bacterium]
MPETFYHIIENVWQRVSPDLKKEIVRFWAGTTALTIQAEALERAEEVVFVVRNLSRKIVGVCTAKKIFSERLNNHVYFYRTMIDPGYRRHGLAIDLLIKTRDFLEGQFKQEVERESIGILLTLENEDLNRTFRKAVWPRTGFIFIGYNRNGHQVRIYYFEGAEI